MVGGLETIVVQNLKPSQADYTKWEMFMLKEDSVECLYVVL